MTLTYFAFGSNLGLPRLRARVPDVVLIGRARLDGYGLAWNKRSADGSGKCNIVQQVQRVGSVYGVLYRMPEAGQRVLDGIEEGYRRIDVEVAVVTDTATLTGAERVRAFTYRADAPNTDDALVPFDWYRDLVIAGAEAAALPDLYLTGLRGTAAMPDPDRDRRTRNRSLLEACRRISLQRSVLRISPGSSAPDFLPTMAK